MRDPARGTPHRIGRGRFGSRVSREIAAFALLLTALAVGPPASAHHLTCQGTPTTIDGTSGNDRIAGTPGDDAISAGAGNDRVDGNGGNDLICGDDGNDRLTSADGADRLDGGPGNDVLSAGAENDVLFGGPGPDRLLGEAGIDAFFGGPGDDQLRGGDGVADQAQYVFSAGPINANLATGIAIGDGTDQLFDIERLVGSNFDDTLIGNAGSNNFIAMLGDDIIDGAGGFDGVEHNFLFDPVTVDLSVGTSTGQGSDHLLNIEAVGGTIGDDLLLGSDGPDSLTGRAGDDRIEGRGGNDDLAGNEGDDFLDGGDGIDVANGGPGGDICLAETQIECEGFDTIRLAQYNVQFQFPELTPDLILDHFDHFPSSGERAARIGAAVACMDIVAFQETSNDLRREAIFSAMEANAAACPAGRGPLIDFGSRFFDFVDGPDNSQTDPVVDDELAIASRFPIIEVHSMVFTDCSFPRDCLADKGAIHARLWRGPGHPASDSIDVFVTHLDTGGDIRPGQLNELAAFIQTYDDPDTPAVIMGDFNIRGNTGSEPEYLLMRSTLGGALTPSPIDVGRGFGLCQLDPTTGLRDPGDVTSPCTNKMQDGRIDYILVSGASATDTGVECFEEFNTDSIRAAIRGLVETGLNHDGISDHCAVLTDLTWRRPAIIPNPALEFPKELRVEVSRLQEITPDVPDAAIVVVPVVLPPPAPPVAIPIPVYVSCDGKTDHFGNLEVRADGLFTSTSFDEDHTIEGDDVTRVPPWEARLLVPGGIAAATIGFALEDDDDLVCGGPNDLQDINPFSGDFGILLEVDFAADGVFVRVGGSRIGFVPLGEAMAFQGTDPDDRARVTLIVESRYSDQSDVDEDGLSDALEVYETDTDPADPDTDDDGLPDGEDVGFA